MQAYGSLALEDNSEVCEAVLGRCSNIVCLLRLYQCLLAPSQEERTHSLQWVLLGEDLVIFPKNL